MRKLLIYGISLTILACALVLGYKHIQARLNPKKTALPPSRLENCQNLEINDPKLIAFANKCLIEDGRNISDFGHPKIKRFTESQRKKVEPELPDEWTVWYHNKKGYMGGDYLVRISLVTCECEVSGH